MTSYYYCIDAVLKQAEKNEAAGNKILLARYADASPTYQAISARRDLTRTCA